MKNEDLNFTAQNLNNTSRVFCDTNTSLQEKSALPAQGVAKPDRVFCGRSFGKPWVRVSSVNQALKERTWPKAPVETSSA